MIIIFFDLGLVLFFIALLAFGALWGAQQLFTSLASFFGRHFMAASFILFFLVFFFSFLIFKKNEKKTLTNPIFGACYHLLLFVPIYINLFFVIIPSFFDGNGLWSLLNGILALLFSWIFCALSFVPGYLSYYATIFVWLFVSERKTVNSILAIMIWVVLFIVFIWATWFVFWWEVPLCSKSVFYDLYGAKLGGLIETIFYGALRRPG